jgi:hypothetical protein
MGFMGDIFQSQLSGVLGQLSSGEALRKDDSLGNGIQSGQASSLEMHEMLHGIRAMGAQGQSQLGGLGAQHAQAQSGQLRYVIAPYLSELARINQRNIFGEAYGSIFTNLDGTVTRIGFLKDIDRQVLELKRRVESFTLLGD